MQPQVGANPVFLTKCIRDLCGQASDYYDEPTDHGRNGKDANQAAGEAIRRYAPQVAAEK
ncbi:MAG TPA: hypothetical protein VJT54_03520 [Verrucomicrobiae bacterium]|nr:hypothetical protein [Verrucomicrobiae bacterium]